MATAEMKNFATPDEVLEFPFGRGEIVTIGGGKVLRITLEPGWRWSDHVKPSTGTELCEAPHFQYVMSGRIAGRMADGSEFEAVAGTCMSSRPGMTRGWSATSRSRRSTGAARMSGVGHRSSR